MQEYVELLFGVVEEHGLNEKKFDDTGSCKSSGDMEKEPISSGLKFQTHCENCGCVEDPDVGVTGAVPTTGSWKSNPYWLERLFGI